MDYPPLRLTCIPAATILLALGLTVPGPAAAYSSAAAFLELPTQGGGGDRFFTGSPAEGFGCDVCHQSQDGTPYFPAYVSGLPIDGYGLAQRQEVVVSWPEFSARWRALRPDPTMPTDKNADLPAMGLLAEFVSESGKASGTIEIDATQATTQERCERTRPNLEPKLAAGLYQVRPGIPPRLVKADSTGMLRCEAKQLGQRCIIAMRSCGAQELRLTWTSPDSWQGPIWFSGGFVATQALESTFDQDSVAMISKPILPINSQSEQYQTVLRGGCTLATTARHPGGSAGLAMLTLASAALLIHRRRSPTLTRGGRR